jgi:YVTN family beta-propeller protein
MFNFGSIFAAGQSYPTQTIPPGGRVVSTLVLANNTLVSGNSDPIASLNPGDLAYDSNNSMLYVSDEVSSVVAEVSTVSNTMVNEIPIREASSLVFDSYHRYIYVASAFDSVLVIDTNTNQIVANITTGGPQYLAYDASNHNVYVTNQGTDNISIINGKTLTGNITMPGIPTGLVYDSNNTNLYVVYNNGQLSVIDGTTNQLSSDVIFYFSLRSVAYNPYSQHLYLIGPENNITVFDPTTNLATATIRGNGFSFLGNIVFDSVNSQMYMVTDQGLQIFDTRTNLSVSNVTDPFLREAFYDPANQNVYVSDSYYGSIDVINSTTNIISTRIYLGLFLQGVDYNPENGNLYVSSGAGIGTSSQMMLVNIQTNRITDSFSIPSPFPMIYDPSNGDVCIGTGSNITEIDPVTHKAGGQVSTGGSVYSMTYDPSNGYIYSGGLATPDSGAIWVIEGANIVASIPLTYPPYGLVYDSQTQNVFAINPYGPTTIINGTKVLGNTTWLSSNVNAIAFDSSNGFMYVTGTSLRNVSIINPTTGATIANVAAGLFPDQVIFDPQNKLIYVTDYGSPGPFSFPQGNVTVINGTSVVNTIPVGREPGAILYDPSNGDVYVLNSYSGTISIISSSQQARSLGYLPFIVPGVVIGIVVSVISFAVVVMRKREPRPKAG